jgi:hypothetical protein
MQEKALLALNTLKFFFSKMKSHDTKHELKLFTHAASDNISVFRMTAVVLLPLAFRCYSLPVTEQACELNK